MFCMATKKVKEVRVIFKRVKDIWSKTFGFTIVRAAWSLVYGLVKILLILLFLWLIVKTKPVAGLIIGLIGIGIVLGISKLFHRYIGYMLKLGYVALIVEYQQTGSLPKEGQFAYAKNKVIGNLGSSSIAALLDQLISGAVNQVTNFLVRAMSFLEKLPGGNFVLSLVKMFLKAATTFIDESVMSYIFINTKSDKSKWKLAYEGIVLYGQSWKEIAKTAASASLITILVRYVLAFILGIIAISSIGFGSVAVYIVIGLMLLVIYAIEDIVVEPMLTASMILTYQDAIKEKTPSTALADKLSKFSSKLRKISQKADEPEEVPVAGGAGLGM